MATKSIMKNLVITDPDAAEIFINALEKASQSSQTTTSTDIKCENLKGEEIKKFLGAFVK